MLIEGRSLGCVRNNRTIYADCTVHIVAGTLTVVRGDNGSGKTTLLHMLAGVLQPDSGTVSYHDGYMPTDAFLSTHTVPLKPMLSACRTIQFLARVHGISLSSQAVHTLLHAWLPTNSIDAPAGTLSFGQQKRALLALLPALQKRIWFLDEPFSGLDSVAITRCMASITTFVQAGGAVVLTTHQSLPVLQELSIQVGEIRLCGTQQ